MNAKEYLSQAYLVDHRIDSKLEQLSELKDLSEKATATISDMPGSATRNVHRLEDVIANMIDLQNEINDDIDGLVNLKREIMQQIKTVPSPEYQLILERRYMSYKPWEQIAVEIGYSLHYLYKMHSAALQAFDEVRKKAQILKLDTK